MNRTLAVLAAALSALALYLPARSQSFTYVSVDGRTTRMLVAGRGGATVVFEGGYPAPLETWGRVQPDVSTFAKTVSYDRAGIGLSDPGRLPRDGGRIASELRAALRAANVPPPYVLVGHSLGGLFVRAFAGLYPDDVTGVVLVDPTHDAEALAFRGTEPEIRSLPATVALLRDHPIRAGIPVVLISAVGPASIPFPTAQVRASRDRRRMERTADSAANQAWVRNVPGSEFIVTSVSGHNVPQEAPGVVIEAIRDVVERRRAPSR